MAANMLGGSQNVRLKGAATSQACRYARIVWRQRAVGKVRRRGNASLDTVLVMGVVLPLATLLFLVVPRIMNLVYEFTSVTVGWPFQ